MHVLCFTLAPLSKYGKTAGDDTAVNLQYNSPVAANTAQADVSC